MIAIPEWIETGETTSRGLDLLGLRNPVQRIGNYCFDGVTTITPTIRYLSIGVVTSSSYTNARQPNQWKPFRDFAAKVEAAVAYGNLLNNVVITGILGSDNARTRIDEAPTIFPLKDLVQQPGINIYAGVSAQLKLTFTSQESGIPGLTKERGLALAEATRAAFEDTRLGREFLEGQSPDEADVDELREFGKSLALDHFLLDERECLIDALIPKRPTESETRRIQTYGCLLSIAERKGSTPRSSDLFEKAQLPDPSSGHFKHILDHWLLYLIRDQVAVVHECVLREISLELESARVTSGGLQSSQQVISSLLSRNDELDGALKRLGVISTHESASEIKFAEIRNRIVEQSSPGTHSENGLVRWDGTLTEEALISEALRPGAGAIVLLPISWILATRRIEGEASESSSRLLSDQGWARLGLSQIIRPMVEQFGREDLTLGEAAGILIRRTVDQHLRIAWSRFAQDPRKLVSVVISDGLDWSSRNKFDAGRTASRLSQAVGWLEQLGLIDSGGLTTEGRRVLSDIVLRVS